ncbi:uncharacterized protein LOC126742428 [Anthonomus grandis grandis]|uniref:uncharacterized protein LOC126742428 n=1 Tax=Anthonomus grandis grandis TaxID=2921223 RepID=UPI0021665877|nr:uncharacterized protein LOC126742428 [Anthonomus grandis grandis]
MASGRNSIFWCVGFCFLVLAEGGPRRSQSRNKDKDERPQLVYDQKQTGDYNIQLHLKDFQIIALLGDDGLGDYEYDYDYSDFTIKPSGPTTSTSTTSKPSSTTTQGSTTRSSSSPSSVASTTSPAKPSMVPNLQPDSLEIVLLEPTKKPIENATFKKPLEESLNIQGGSTEESSSSSSSTPSILSLRLSSPKPDSLDKIKVQIVEGPGPSLGNNLLPLGIVPGEDVQSDSGEVLQGEIASYRKCASGFSRDKKGRCRRLRKPAVASQLPFGFGRIASNLATRLRLPTPVSDTELSTKSL